MSKQTGSSVSQSHAAAHGGHEERDISVAGIVIFVVTLAVVCVITGAAMLAMFRYLDNRLVEREAPVSPLAMPSGQPPPEPRLLTNEPANLATYRLEQEQNTATYGWIDKQAGIVRIPIERAKELLLERGLPHR